MNVILVDDEKPSLVELEYLLKKEKDINIINTFTDPVKALESIALLKPDVVFLDIEMPIINGLNVAAEIIDMQSNIEIVFVTAFNEYAIKAFEINAIDYLLKPVDRIRLSKTLAKLYAATNKKHFSKNSLLNTMNYVEKYIDQDIKKIIVWVEEEIILLKSEDILFLETDSGNTFIYTESKKYKTRSTMDSWEEKLGDKGFFRCHRSFIINLNHVNKISPMFNSYEITMDNSNHKVPLSRSNAKKLKGLLGF